MIVGARYWNEASRYSQQNNNPEEEALRVALEELSAKYKFPINVATHYEFCGPTAAVNAHDAVGAPFVCRLPGGYILQTESLLTDFFRDPVNYPLLKAVVGEKWFDPVKTPANRVLKCYPAALKATFGWESVYKEKKTAWKDLPQLLRSNVALVLCLESPGHYICVKAFDDKTNELIYNDPWNFRGGVHGFNRRMSYGEWNTNTRPFELQVVS